MNLNFSETELKAFVFMKIIEDLCELFKTNNGIYIYDDCDTHTITRDDNKLILTKKDPEKMTEYELAEEEYYIVQFLDDNCNITKVYGSKDIIITYMSASCLCNPEEYPDGAIEIKLVDGGWEATDSVILEITKDGCSIGYGMSLFDPTHIFYK